MGWASLITVILKIVTHFLENKTPESKKNYVKNLEEMSAGLAHNDVESVNDLFNRMREEVREGDSLGLSPDEITLRKLRSDTSMD